MSTQPNPAEGLEQARPLEETPTINSEESAVADAPEGGEAEPQETQEQGETQSEHKGKRIGGWQRKIQKLKQENEWLRNIARTSTPQQQQQSAAPAKDNRPKMEDFTVYEDYLNASIRYEAKEIVRQEREAEEKRALEENAKVIREKAIRSWNEQCDAEMEEHDDFDEVINDPKVRSHPILADAIVTSEAGAKLAYYLGKNPAESARLADLAESNPIVAIREIGKLEARLAKAQPTAEPAAKPRPPKPPTPISKTSSTDNSLSDNLSEDEWLRRRNAQLRSRR